MTRRSLAWLLTLPLAVVGSQVAHGLAYRLGTQGDAERAHELTASGHGYLAYAPLFVAICAVLVSFALCRELLAAFVADRRPGAPRPSALHFAILAPAIFVAQEHLERFAHEGAFPTALFVEETFAIGLALQLPFALLAFALAWLLLRAIHAVARLLSTRRVALAVSLPRWHCAEVSVRETSSSGLALGPRGPPLLTG